MAKTANEKLIFEKIDMTEKQVDLMRDDQCQRWKIQNAINNELFSKFNKIKEEISDLKVEILERLHKLEKRVAIIAVTVSFIMSMLGPWLYELIKANL